MVLKSADRVLETTTTTGVSSFSLGGALTGYQTFNAGVGNGNKCYYAAVHSDLGSYAQWEVGIGTLSGGATLTRQAISSSNSNNLVSFSTGTKYIFVTTPAIRGAVYDDDGKLFIGPSGDSATFGAQEYLHVKGDVYASGVNLGSGLSLTAGSAPIDTTGRLYNVGGSLYWAGEAISASEGQQLFTVIAGASGTTEGTYANFPVMVGSGFVIKGGENIDLTLDHPDHAPGQGSGILTINATNTGSLLRVAAPSGEVGGAQKEYELTYGSGLLFQGERNIDIQLSNNAQAGGNGASGILTFRGPDLSSYLNAVASGIELQNNTVVATTGNTLQKGIVQLTNEITDSSGLALTPRAVYDAGYATPDDIIINIGATTDTGSGVVISRAPSGIFFSPGANIGLNLTDTGDGSGILTISSSDTDTTYGAASGLVMDGDNIIRHAESAASSVNNSNPNFIQDITIDDYGHITAINSSSVTAPEVSTSLILSVASGEHFYGDKQITLGDGSGILFIGQSGIHVGLEGGPGWFAGDAYEGTGVIRISHADTSNASSANNSGNTFIQDITIDEFGHITSLVSAAVSATSTNINTDGTPTTVASGGIPIFQDADSIHYDPNLTWSSGNLNGTLTIGGYVKIDQLAAPSVTTDKLYNVGGALTWNGTNISAGIGAGALTTQGSDTPQVSGIPFFSSSSTLGYQDRLVYGSGTNATLGITSGAGKENNFPHSTLHADGSFATRVTSVTGINDEATATDSIISLDNRHINNHMTFYLPQVSTCMGRVYTLIRNSNHASGIAIAGSGTDTIDGKPSETLWVDGDALTVVASSGHYGYDYGWKALHREYTPHAVRLQLLPTGDYTPRSHPGSIVEEAFNTNAVFANPRENFVNYQWNVGAFMTFEGTQWCVPAAAGSGTIAGSTSGFYAESGLVQNYTSLRDGNYRVDFHLATKRAYNPDYHHPRVILVKYPYRGTELEANPGYLGTPLARLELNHILNRTTQVPNGFVSWHDMKASHGGDSTSIGFYGSFSEVVPLEENDKLLFLFMPRRNGGTFGLNNDGTNFPDTQFFKAIATMTYVTITEIR